MNNNKLTTVLVLLGAVVWILAAYMAVVPYVLLLAAIGLITRYTVPAQIQSRELLANRVGKVLAELLLLISTSFFSTLVWYIVNWLVN